VTASTSPTELSTLDVLDPTLFVRGVAHDTFDALRAYDPVHWDERNGIWVLTGYDDVAHAERHPEVFSSANGVRPRGEAANANLSIVSMDDPEHARQRRLIARGVTPKRIAELVERIRGLARELVDRVAARGECDFVTDLAAPLPLIVIAELLGLPVDDRERLREWSDTMIGSEGSTGPDDPRLARAAAAWSEYVTYLDGLLEERRAQPRDDLISVLVSSAESGELASDFDALHDSVRDGDVGRSALALRADEVLSFLVLLLVAGNETTRNALSGGMVALSEFPEQRARLAADLALVPSATEEILRYVSPVLNFSRTVAVDTELRGRTLRAGDAVLLCYPAANRDPQVFDAPHDLRIDRSPNLHLAFGAGPHFCLGANLARTEIRILLEELFARLPDAHVPAGAHAARGPSTLVATIESLPVAFTPAP